jgi:hypothetical protein
MAHPITPSTARRIRREGYSAARREIALKLHLEGKTLAEIGAVLGVSITRVHQMLKKAKRLLAAQEKRAPLRQKGCPLISNVDPLAAGRNERQGDLFHDTDMPYPASPHHL